jgi:hypothetical protein
MFEALRRRGKEPRREICRWNSSPAVRAEPSYLNDPSSPPPSPANPIVYHLHGHLGLPESLVLTEDDYLDFLVAVSRDEDLLPPQIQRALAGTSAGLRRLPAERLGLPRHPPRAGDGGRAEPRRLSVTVQLPRANPAQTYLDKYFGAMKVRVYWGDAREFVRDLRDRWRAAGDGRA